MVSCVFFEFSRPCICIVEVRDSRTGYLLPVRDGLGVWPDGRVLGTSPPPPSPSSGNSGRHSGQETIFGVFHMVLGSWWEIIENGDRGSTQNFDTNLVSIVVWPGEPFWKKCLFWPYFQGYHVHFPGTCSQNRFFPQTLQSESSFSVFPGSQVLRIVRFSVFPGSQVINIDCFLVLPGSQVVKIMRFPIFPGSQIPNPSRCQ